MLSGIRVRQCGPGEVKVERKQALLDTQDHEGLAQVTWALSFTDEWVMGTVENLPAFFVPVNKVEKKKVFLKSDLTLIVLALLVSGLPLRRGRD